MNRVFTKAGVELINYTRYNSKDLIALMEAVETAIGAQGINCNPPGPPTTERSSPTCFAPCQSAAGTTGTGPGPHTRISLRRTCPIDFKRAITSWPR